MRHLDVTRVVVFASYISLSSSASNCLSEGPQEAWRTEWHPRGEGSHYTCVPTFIHKLQMGENVTLAASCGFSYEQMQSFGGRTNDTVGDSSVQVPVPAGSIYSVGAANPFLVNQSESEYLAGAGVVTKVDTQSVERLWTYESPVDTVCNSARFAQTIAPSRMGVVTIGYCGNNVDSVLYLDQLSDDGVLLDTIGFDVSWWNWTGVSRHRASIKIEDVPGSNETYAYIAAQAEGADRGWLVKLNWTEGITFQDTLFNQTLIWEEREQPIPIRIIVDLVKKDITTNVVLLARGYLSLLSTDTGELLGPNSQFQVDVAREWDVIVMPHNRIDAADTSQDNEVSLVLGYNTNNQHPLERIFLRFFEVQDVELISIHFSEVDTNRDMLLRTMTIGPYAGSIGIPSDEPIDYGVWIGAYLTCSGENPCSALNNVNDTAIVINFNMSNFGKQCSACKPGWAGATCTDQCECVHGGGSTGACYDGPYHNGSCRCNYRTYKDSCFPCLCENGVCDGGENGTGLCLSCSDGSYGIFCKPCTCGDGETCDEGVQGSGGCRSAPSKMSSGWHWKMYYTIVAAVAGVGVVVLLLVVYRMCRGGRGGKATGVHRSPQNINRNSYGAVDAPVPRDEEE